MADKDAKEAFIPRDGEPMVLVPLAPVALDWLPMENAPRKADVPILLLSRIHGVTEARFSPGEWSDDTPNGPREYSGAMWICGDDAWEIEVEETPDGYDDGEAVGWLPREVLPAGVPD